MRNFIANLIKSKVFTWSCVIFFSGCSSVNKNIKSKSLDKFSNAQYEQEIANIYNFSHTEQFSSDQSLNLYDLLNIALENNPLTKIAWRQVTLSSLRKIKADSVFYPRIDVSLTAVRSEQLGGLETSESEEDNVKNKHLTTSFSSVLFPQVAIKYSIFKFGAHKESSRAALSMLEASNLQFNQVLQDVVFYVELAYFNIDSAEAIVEANEQNLEDTKVALDVVRNRYQVGLANKQDFLRAKAAYSVAIFDLENSRATVESARANLAKTIGVSVSENFNIERATIEEIPDIDCIEKFIEQAINSRQDVQAQQKILEAKKHQFNSAKYNTYPELTTGVTASRKKIKNIPGMYNNFEAFIGINWNIFDGYSSMADKLMAREEMKIEKLKLKSSVLDVISQVWTHFHAFKSSVSKLRAAQKSESFARESLNCAREEYRNGLCSFTDLLTSQNALSLARKNLVCSKNDLAIELVKLSYCTGKILEK